VVLDKETDITRYQSPQDEAPLTNL